MSRSFVCPFSAATTAAAQLPEERFWVSSVGLISRPVQGIENTMT
jgi:hypothetical protein